MAFVRLFLLKSNQRPKRLPSPEPAVFQWQFFWRWKITLFWYQQVQVLKTKQTMISGNVRTTTRVYHSEGKPLGIKRSQNKRHDLSFSFKIPPSFDAVNKYTSYKYFGYFIWDEKDRECGGPKDFSDFFGEMVLEFSAKFVFIKKGRNDNNEKVE